MNRLSVYEFSIRSGNKNIADFLCCIDQILSVDNAISFNANTTLSLKIKKNFYDMIRNFEKFMYYANINEKWQSTNYNQHNDSMSTLVQKTKKATQRILLKGILQPNYTNLIFEFHQYKPLVSFIPMIYKLLINSIIDIDIDNEDGVDLKKIFTLYLLHAATYNNSVAIEILLKEYHASPLKSWPVFNDITNKPETKIMPIIQLTTNTKNIGIDKSSFNISCLEQEYNFILMLNNINFTETTIKTWKIQEIFRCAFKNNFIEAMNHLLAQSAFCQKLILTEEDLIMIAFVIISIPEYNILVNMIISKDNLLKNAVSSVEDPLKKIQYYQTTLQNMTKPTPHGQIFDYGVIKIVLNFLSYFLDRNPEHEFISNWLTVVNLVQEKLQTENTVLLQNNFKLQADILLLNKQLKISELSGLSMEYIESIRLTLTNQKIVTLQKQIHDYKTFEYKNHFLINENRRLQETLDLLIEKTPSSSSASLTDKTNTEQSPPSQQSPISRQSHTTYCILHKTTQMLYKLAIHETYNIRKPQDIQKPIIKRRHSFCL